MPYSSLRDFMTRLEREGRLVRVREPVSTVLEMTEIQTRLLAENGPAVLFEHPLKADGSAPCHEVVLTGNDIDLAALPVQTCWPGEPAPLITWPLVVTKGPSAAREDDFNLGIYRMQVLGRDRTIMRWLAHRGGAQHHRRWKAEGRPEPLPACAVIGADPGTILAAG